MPDLREHPGKVHFSDTAQPDSVAMPGNEIFLFPLGVSDDHLAVKVARIRRQTAKYAGTRPLESDAIEWEIAVVHFPNVITAARSLEGNFLRPLALRFSSGLKIQFGAKDPHRGAQAGIFKFMGDGAACEAAGIWQKPVPSFWEQAERNDMFIREGGDVVLALAGVNAATRGREPF